MQLKTTSQPLFFELNIPIKLIDLSTKFCTVNTANFERHMEIGKANTTAAATVWYRYNNAAAASAFYASTKTSNKKSLKLRSDCVYIV